MSIKKLKNQLFEADGLLKKIETSEEAPNITIAKHILSWIGLENSFFPDMILSGASNTASKSDVDNERDTILQVIHDYSNKAINESDFLDIQCRLKPFDHRKDQRADRSELNTQAVNTIFKQNSIPYQIKGCKDKNSNCIYYTITQKEAGTNERICSVIK